MGLSPAEYTQKQIIAYLNAQAATLAIDARTPTVIDELPDEGYIASNAPIISIPIPTVTDHKLYSTTMISQNLDFSISIFETHRAEYDAYIAAKARLQNLANKVAHTITQGTKVALNQFYAIPFFVNVSFSAIDPFGSELIGIEMSLSIPIFYNTTDVFV